MHHRLRGLFTYGLNTLGKGDVHMPTLQEGQGTLYLFTIIRCTVHELQSFYAVSGNVNNIKF